MKGNQDGESMEGTGPFPRCHVENRGWTHQEFRSALWILPLLIVAAASTGLYLWVML